MQSNSTKFARRYDREFKQNAVALIQSGRSITEVSRDLGVSHWSLSRWLKDTNEVSLSANLKPFQPRRRSSASCVGCARRTTICAGSATF